MRFFEDRVFSIVRTISSKDTRMECDRPYMYWPKLNEKEWQKTKLEHNLATDDIPEHSYWHYKRIV